MKLYKTYFGLHVKSLLEFRLSFLLTTLGQFLVSFNVFLGVYFMFARFQTVEGFTFEECLLCFSVVLVSFSLAECFFRSFDTFPSMLSNGEFDRILVRPQNIILQVLGTKIEFSRIGRVLQALIMLGYALSQQVVNWSILKVICFILMIIGGIFLFASLYILFAGICFFTLDGLELMNILTDGAREYGKYPLSIYGKNVLKFTTYFIPYALFQYYPFLYLIDRQTNPYTILLPVICMLFFIPSYWIWYFGLQKYQSTGS